MNKGIIFGLFLMAGAAQAADLVLPGERWVATFNKYVCDTQGAEVARPNAFDQLNVQFERLTTDRSLDNALVKATFVAESGATCRYNAILFADNAAYSAELVQSIAYNPNGGATTFLECKAGKEVIDEAFAHTQYLYYGRPHNIAFLVPGVGAESVCGSSHVGVNFVVTGRIQQ